MVETQIILEGKQAKQWTMMNMLDSVGFFDIIYGRATIDFDGQGKISNLKIEKNYRVAPTA
jgi:hypothetical protein